MRGGECVLCYYSSVLQCIIGISEPFKVSDKEIIGSLKILPHSVNIVALTGITLLISIHTH